MADVGLRWLACGEYEPPPTDDWLSARDRHRLGTMTYAKRYDEARMSRWTAQRAVALLAGIGDDVSAVGRVAVTNASDGSPRATVPGVGPVSISSTDRAGWAVSMVTHAELAIGCDLELVEPRSEAFVRDWFTPAEQESVGAGGLPWEVATNLVWSAKESALKVLRTGLRRDTRTVSVTFESGGEDGWAALWVDDSVTGRRFPGWWRRHGDFLLTTAAEAPLPPPESLVQPEPLATAAPMHSWMGRPRRPPGAGP